MSRRMSRLQSYNSFKAQAPPSYQAQAPLDTAAAERLPEYSSGTSMAPTNLLAAGSTSSCTVSVLLDHSRNRIYDIEDVVSGQIVFVPKRDCTLACVYATLSGEQLTTCRQRWGLPSPDVCTRSMRLGQYVVPPTAFPETAGGVLKKGWTYSFRFSIQVPLTTIERAEAENGVVGGGEQKRAWIPPTLGVSPDMDQGDGRPASIYYYVNASVSTVAVGEDEESVYAAEFPPFVTIMPSYPNYPQAPSYTDSTATLDGSSGEEQVKLETCDLYRRKFLQKTRKHVGKVALTLTQPLIISQDASDISTASVCLRFTPTDRQARPPAVSAIVVRLDAVTKYADPTSTNSSTHSLSYAEPLSVDQLPIQKVTWKPHNGAFIGDVDIPMQLPLPPAVDGNTVPCFTSELVSRSYELRVSISYEPAGHSTTSFTVPACVTASFVPKPHYLSPLLDVKEFEEAGEHQTGYSAVGEQDGLEHGSSAALRRHRELHAYEMGLGLGRRLEEEVEPRMEHRPMMAIKT